MLRRALAIAVIVVLAGCSSSSASQSEDHRRKEAPATRVVGGFTIQSESMVPALKPEQHVQAVAVDADEIRRGDVLVFETPDGAQQLTSASKVIARVVGLPGEMIEGRDGRI